MNQDTRQGITDGGKNIFENNWKDSVSENAQFGIVSGFCVDFQLILIFIPTD